MKVRALKKHKTDTLGLTAHCISEQNWRKHPQSETLLRQKRGKQREGERGERERESERERERARERERVCHSNAARFIMFALVYFHHFSSKPVRSFIRPTARQNSVAQVPPLIRISIEGVHFVWRKKKGSKTNVPPTSPHRFSDVRPGTYGLASTRRRTWLLGRHWRFVRARDESTKVE